MYYTLYYVYIYVYGEYHDEYIGRLTYIYIYILIVVTKGVRLSREYVLLGMNVVFLFYRFIVV